MKSIFKSFVAVMAIAGIVSVSSCTKTCDPGYEGTDCKTEMRTKFLKTAVTVTEDCSSTTYSSDIINGSSISEVKIKNLGNYTCPSGDYYVVATVDGSTLTIAQQGLCNVGGTNVYTITGTGTVANNVVTITYHVTATGVDDNCVATY